MKNKIGIKSYKSDSEHNVEEAIFEAFRNTPIPNDQLLENLGIFISSKDFSRLLFMHHIYQKIIDVPGIIMDFGTRWGNNLALFSTFRSMYEPFNRHRKIIGFDTFTGFPELHEKDGKSNLMATGNAATTLDYQSYLEHIMSLKEKQNPLSHIKKFELRTGDACVELPKFLDENPQTIIALAYFDFDIYIPTLRCLEIIKDRLVKGSIIGFDELNDEDSPGETLALMEVFGLGNIKLKRLPITSRTSYFTLE